MTSLIARLEAATEGSRELDAEIAAHIGIRHRSRRVGGVNKGREWFVDTHGGIEEWSRHPPAFSTSIDAALTLVPEGWYWQLSHYDLPTAVLGPRQAPDHDPVEAPTPALALCIAALKARSAP